MKHINICKICGLPEGEHHVFDPIVVPDGCVCDIRCWGSVNHIQPICNHYEPDPDPNFQDVCKNCEHDKACHTSP